MFYTTGRSKARYKKKYTPKSRTSTTDENYESPNRRYINFQDIPKEISSDLFSYDKNEDCLVAKFDDVFDDPKDIPRHIKIIIDENTNITVDYFGFRDGALNYFTFVKHKLFLIKFKL